MSFSLIYQFMIQKRVVIHREIFFQRLYDHLQRLRVKDQQKWMHDYLYALNCHCVESDIFYYISTRSIEHFYKSLITILNYGNVELLCLDICYRHVCHHCTCRHGETYCLQPHV